LALLRTMGCDVVQGYLLAQPLEPNALGPWIEEWAQRWPTYAAPSAAAAIPTIVKGSDPAEGLSQTA
jgi:hypothetical protein